MASAVVGIAASVAGKYAAAFLIPGGGILAAIVGAVISFGVQALGSSLLGVGKIDKPSSVDSSISNRQRGILANVASTVQPIPVVYGSARVGGTICFMEISGTQNEYMHMVIAMAEGPVNAINTVYIDEQDSTVSKFSGLVTIYKHLGDAAQTVDTTLQANFPTAIDSNFRLRGVAYIYVILKYDPDVFLGVPTITADIDGRQVYDPRTGTTAWSDNPALCTRDYLTNTLYGCALPNSVMDDTAIATEANYCEELVSLIGGGGTQKRYTCNGVLTTDQTRMANMRALQSCYNGMLIFSAGLYKIAIDKPATYSYDFNIDNIIGEWTISLGDKKNKYNTVAAEYVDPTNNSQPNIALDTDSSIRALDNNLVLKNTINLPFVNDYNRALRLAHIDLWRSRFSIVVEFTATFSALDMVAGDICSITHITPMWYGKLFRVVKLRLNANGTVRVTAKEYNGLIYEPPASGSAGTATYTLSDLNKRLVASINANKIIDAAVSGAKLADGAVVAAKVGSGAIGSSNIAASAVGNTQIQSGAVTTAKVGAGAITTAVMADSNVTTGKMAANAISAQSYAYTAGVISHDNGAGVSTLIQSAAITTSGGQIIIVVSFAYDFTNTSNSPYFYVNRGGTNIFNGSSAPCGQPRFNGYYTYCSMTIIDAPAAGTYTYYVYWVDSTSPGGANNNCAARTITLNELKR